MKKQILILSGFVLCFLIGLLFQINRESKLENSVETVAIVEWRSKALGKGHGVGVRFYLKGKIVTTSMNCPCQDIELGDTVLIKYSVKDPELAVMVDKYYMQKYKDKNDSRRQSSD